MAPDSTKPTSFTRTDGTAMAEAAFWLSRLASSTRPARALRRPFTNTTTTARMARQKK